MFDQTTSPIYPGRPIRPLPKKPLRSRLSPEQADSILYPPAPSSSKPLFFPVNSPPPYPSGLRASSTSNGALSAVEYNAAAYRAAATNGYSMGGIELESDEEDGIGILRRHQEQRHPAPRDSPKVPNRMVRPDITKYPKPSNLQSTASSAESADGYDSFENTNNKKKRKIPISGSIGNHHVSLSSELAQMDIRSDQDSLRSEGDNGVSQYYGSGSSAALVGPSGTGISGAGRGRFGRSGARLPGGRSPLGISTNGSNTLHSTRNPSQRNDYALGSGRINPGI